MRVNVACVLSTAGRTIDYGGDGPSELEGDCHGVDVAGMFFFHDNTFVLREGDPSASDWSTSPTKRRSC